MQGICKIHILFVPGNRLGNGAGILYSYCGQSAHVTQALHYTAAGQIITSLRGEYPGQLQNNSLENEAGIAP